MANFKKYLPKWIFRNKLWTNNSFVWVRGNFSHNSITISNAAKFKNFCYINFWRNSSNNTLTIGKNFAAKDLRIVFKGNNCNLTIGDNVTLEGHILIVGKNRAVKVGNNTVVKGAYIMCRDANISIGDNCLLSRQIEIRSTDVHKIYDLDTNAHLNPGRPVTIGNKIWIGAKVLISKGAIIPDGCIIGATSFVNKAFTEENVVIAGTPAKIVKRNIYWKR